MRFSDWDLKGEIELALRAVIFDYGMVLTGPQDAESHNKLMQLTGLPLDRFEQHYWADRHAYDEGKLSGLAFWRKFVCDAGLGGSATKTEALVEELNRIDARMWTTENSAMVAWQLALKERGLKTGILSNMGDNVLENILREFAWIARFDSHIWSYQHLMAKPDPAIYHLALNSVGAKPEEALFLDDKLVNIEAAQVLGMHAIQFSDVARLRKDLVSAGFDAYLPLP